MAATTVHGTWCICHSCRADQFANAELVDIPFSEAAIYLRIAGQILPVCPVGFEMAQVFETDGRPILFPITRSEAGLPLRGVV